MTQLPRAVRGVPPAVEMGLLGAQRFLPLSLVIPFTFLSLSLETGANL